MIKQPEHEVVVRRRVKECIEIGDCRSLNKLIEQLIAIRDRLPDADEAEVRMRGDDMFGYRLMISHADPHAPEATGLEHGHGEQELRAAA